MAVNIYEPCINPVTGETFRAISFTPESFTMQWTVYPKGYVPFEHIHLNQDEVFYIQKGELRIVINGKEHIGGAGRLQFLKVQRISPITTKMKYCNAWWNINPDLIMIFLCNAL
jgi:Cupin domain